MAKRVATLVILAGAVVFSGGCARQVTKAKMDPVAVPASVASAPAVSDLAAQKGAQPAGADGAERGAGEVVQPTPPQLVEGGELEGALHSVYFDYDAHLLSEEARSVLARNAEILKEDPAARVRVEGNCDERGSDEYNLALGDRRARSAARYLWALGVPEKRLSVISYGEEKPADPGHDEAAWAKNRRDDFVIIGR